MSSLYPSDPELLKAVLDPLLEDFRYWFGRSIQLLESEKIHFFSVQEQQNLLQKIQEAQRQVSAAQALSAATQNQAGIDMPLVMTWHQLVQECWQVASRFRQETKPNPQRNH
ncbi:MAG: DUF2605 domain-containing protein [Cyanobacteria bacterium P01_A01_bin.114]